MIRILTRQGRYLLLFIMILCCWYGRLCRATPVPAETENTLAIRSCLNFGGFLCLDLSGTNHIQIIAPKMRHVGGFPFEVSTVTFGDYEFWIEKNGVVRFFWVKERRELDKHVLSCQTLPSAQGIRDFICPNINFIKEPTTLRSHGPPLSVHYDWGRKESRDLIHGPNFYWEWVYVEMDEKTRQCLKAQNTVKAAR